MQFSFAYKSLLLSRCTAVLCAMVIGLCLNASGQENSVKLRWGNMLERYDSFHSIKPQIINEANVTIYFDTYFSPFVELEWFDPVSKTWSVSSVWHCGTGYKPRPRTIKAAEQIPILVDTIEWIELTVEDSIGIPKFKKAPGYDGTGTYRLRFSFGTKKSALNTMVSRSPEFIVDERSRPDR